MNRVLITGLAGSGKTTLARRLSATTGLPWHSLDDLYYGPDLAMAPSFPAAVSRVTTGDGGIVDSGGPPDPALAPIRNLMWSRADTLIWLDYSRPVVLWRATSRSLRRRVTRERHRYRPKLSRWQKNVNRAHARIRAIGERANATLKTWKVLTKLRCCPRRATAIVQAILVLHHVENPTYVG